MIAVNAERIQQRFVNDRSDSHMTEGWAFPMVGDILAVNYGKGLKKAKRMSGSIPVYGSNGIVGEHNVAFTHEGIGVRPTQLTSQDPKQFC